jgi:hypothetical protein
LGIIRACLRSGHSTDFDTLVYSRIRLEVYLYRGQYSSGRRRRIQPWFTQRVGEDLVSLKYPSRQLIEIASPSPCATIVPLPKFNCSGKSVCAFLVD